MNGKDGFSVTSSVESAGTNCKSGGSKFVSASGATFACNGEDGKEGSPWTAGGVLPKEKSELGDWSVFAHAAGAGEFFLESVSFGIPLAAAPAPHYIRANGKEPVLNSAGNGLEEVTSTVCKGSVAAPSAEPGNLCVYASGEANLFTNAGTLIIPAICALASAKEIGGCIFGSGPSHTRSADRTGFGIAAASKGAGAVEAFGTWAVAAAE